MGGCNRNCELTHNLSGTCQIHCIYAIHDYKCLQWIACLLACMDARKIFFRNNFFGSQPFLKTCNFTNIFVHLPVIVAVCYFSVHKLKGWDPADIYLFKFNSRNIRKRYEICRKLTINTIESRSDVFSVKCFYC